MRHSGARAGVATGALAAFVSNFFLGQGIWTPQQMLGWGACGAAGALLAPMLESRWSLAAVDCRARLRVQREHGRVALVGLLPAHAAVARGGARHAGFWFDVAHAAGNVVIALAAGPELRRLLERYRVRLRTEVVWA